MCPVTANQSNEYERFQYIEISLLDRICREMDLWPSIETIWLFHFGEPLAHPKFRECLEIVYQSKVARNAQVIMHTNASMLKGEKANALLEVPVVKKLVFPFDGFGDVESYEILRGPHYHEVMRNIKNFSKQAKKVRPELLLTTCTILPREGEVPGLKVISCDEAVRNLKGIFNPLGIQVETREMHDYSGNEKLEIAGRRRNIFGGCPFVEQDSLYFTVKGKAQPCCAVYNENFNVGSIVEMRMGELLNSEKMSNIRHLLRLDKRKELEYCKNCALSLGGYLSNDNLREFWIKRDEQQLIDDLEERKYLFTEVVPELHRAVRVDLGCGGVKRAGFIGIDRFPLPGVDIVADMNKGLPLDDNSVDYLVASHSLEHADDIIFIMQEIYRVCKHKALVCIVAPYYHTSLNMANPFHKQVFNEHTPRFFTTSHHTLIDKLDYDFPHAPNWGIAESDNSKCKMDFRCLRIEFFYFPQYRRLDENEKRKLRQTSINVVDQIMYHLLVVKEDISNKEIEDMAKVIEYQEPPYITLRRYQAKIEDLRLENEKLKSSLEQELTKREELEHQLKEIEEKYEQDYKNMETYFFLEREKNEQKYRDLELLFKLEKQKSEEKYRDLELRFKLEKEQSEQKCRDLELHLKREWEHSKEKVRQLVSEYVKNSFGRQTRIAVRLRRILFGCFDLANLINKECRPILESSILQSTFPLNNYVLGISSFIRKNEIFAYKIQMQQDSLKGLKIVLSCLGDLSDHKAPLAIEILSQEENILRNIFIDPQMIRHNLPVKIEFEPLHNCAGKAFWVRFVGLEDVEEYGIRVYEWQRYSKILKRKLECKLFAELLCD